MRGRPEHSICSTPHIKMVKMERKAEGCNHRTTSYAYGQGRGSRKPSDKKMGKSEQNIKLVSLDSPCDDTRSGLLSILTFFVCQVSKKRLFRLPSEHVQTLWPFHRHHGRKHINRDTVQGESDGNNHYELSRAMYITHNTTVCTWTVLWEVNSPRPM